MSFMGTMQFDIREASMSQARRWRSALDVVDAAYGSPAIFEAIAKLKALTADIRAEHRTSPEPLFKAARDGGETALRAYDSIRGNVGLLKGLLADNRAALAAFESAARALAPPVATASGAVVAAGPFTPRALPAVQFTSEAEIDVVAEADLRNWRDALTRAEAAVQAREPLIGRDTVTNEPRPLEALRDVLSEMRRRWSGAAVPSAILTPALQLKLDRIRKRVTAGAMTAEKALTIGYIGGVQEALAANRAVLEPSAAATPPAAPTAFTPAPPAPVRSAAWQAPVAKPSPFVVAPPPVISTPSRWPYALAAGLLGLAALIRLLRRRTAS